MPSTERRPVVALLLAALSAFVLRDVLFFGRSFFERDLGSIYFAQIESFVRAIAAGSLPLRDPAIAFGQSLAGNPESQVMYPLTWLHLVFQPTRALSLIVFCHFLIGGVGAAALAGRFLPGRLTSFLAGAFWIVSGPFLSALNVYHHFAGAAWIPWVLWAFDRYLEGRSLPRMLSLGALFGAQILAGSADMCAFTLLLALVRLVCEVIPGSPRPGRRHLAGILGALLVAIALGAAVWMPVSEIVGTSARAELSRQARTESSVHPLAAAELVLPVQAGILPLRPDVNARLNDGRSPFLKSLFAGALTLPLLAACLANAAIEKKRRVFLASSAALALLYSFGKFAPFYDAAVTLLPPLGIFRYPSKAAIPLSLLLALMAGLGAQSLRTTGVRRACAGLSIALALLNASLFAGLGSLLAAFLDTQRPLIIQQTLAEAERGLLLSAILLGLFTLALLSRSERLMAATAVCGLCATVIVNRDVNLTVPEAVMRYRPPHVDLLTQGPIGRVHAFDYFNYPARAAQILNRSSLIVRDGLGDVDPASLSLTVLRGMLMAPTGGAWGLEYAWDKDMRGLFDSRLRELTVRLQDALGTDTGLRMLQIANVRHVVALHASTFERLTLKHQVPVLLPEPLFIFEVPGTRPRAYAVSGSRVMPGAAAEQAILRPDFDPSTEVIVDEGSPRPASASFEGAVTIVERKTDRISLEANLNEPGHVVLVEGFLPGWRVTIDGVAAPLQRANALFLAVATPAGRHEVVFSYRPSGALFGIGLSTVTAALLGLFALTQLKR